MDNRIFRDRFCYGASCAPYAKSMDWPMAEWDDDLARMRKLDFTVARIFVPWDRIERREGEFDFSKQDHLLELAAKHGVGVILNVGGVFDNLQGIYPPQWLVRNYAVQPPQPDPRQPARHFGTRHHVCLDDPTFRERSFAFVARAVQHYAGHPATLGWMVWNEPWLRQCYCPATTGRFHIWLKDKYQDHLDELNRRWGTEFPLSYERWEEVEPPTGSGFLGGGLIAWQDWREFSEWRLTDAMTATARIIKANDPQGHLTTANLGHSFAEGNRHTVNLRISEMSAALDVMGFSYYTVAHGEQRHATPFLLSLYVDSFRWFSRDPRRRTLALETEAGPNMAMITEAQRNLSNWLAIGHNVKGILCWNYRSRHSDNQVANFNLMAWDGTPTRRAEHHARMARIFHRHAPLINHCFPEPQAAMLVSDELTLAAMATHQGIDPDGGDGKGYQRVDMSRNGAFKLLWDMNIAVDGLAEHNLAEIGRHRLVLLPMIENMTPAIARALREYVAGGGTLIAESPFAFKDENNFLLGYAPIYGLDEVFGCRTNDREGWETASAITHADGTKARVCFLWHAYETTTGKAVATYDDGRAAIVAHDFGKGRAIVAGTEVFRQYLESPDAANTAFLQRAIVASGAQSNGQVLIGGQPAAATGIEVCRLTGEPGTIYIVLNHNQQEKSFRLLLDEENEPAWTDLVTDAQVSLNDEIVLPPLGVLAFAHNHLNSTKETR